MFEDMTDQTEGNDAEGEEEEEEEHQQMHRKKPNTLPLWGNLKTMNLNPLILANIQSSTYFKVNLYELKTYHEVIDEIYYKVYITSSLVKISQIKLCTYILIQYIILYFCHLFMT